MNQFSEKKYYNMDCMKLMEKYSDKYFDLAIVDPPYGLPNSSKNGSGKLKNRALNTMNTEWDNKIPDNFYFQELFRVSKNQIIWGGNYFPLPPTRGIICWDKVQPWKNFSQIEYAWTSYDCPAKLFKLDNKTKNKIHPTQKPVKLYEWLLNNYAKPGQLILDTHVGSASSLIACENLGFKYIGCELDENYYNESLKRLQEHCEQQKLFK